MSAGHVCCRVENEEGVALEDREKEGPGLFIDWLVQNYKQVYGTNVGSKLEEGVYREVACTCLLTKSEF